MADETEHYSGPVVTRKAAKEAGLTRYFTGKPCKWSHLTWRQTSTGQCRLCENKRHRNRPDIARRSQRRWRAAHPGLEAERRRQYRRAVNPEIELHQRRAEAKAAGLKWYFTGLPCKKGHVAQRNTITGACDDCVRDRYLHNEVYRAGQRAWRAANKEHLRQLALKSYKADPERARQRTRKWVASRPGYGAAKQRQRRASDPNAKAKEAAWRKANPERTSEYCKKWAKSNPEAVRVKNHRRRVRKRENGGIHSAADIKKLFKIQKDRCAHSWCRVSIKKGYEIDHVIPLSRGGSNDRRNIQLLCKPCNQEKHDKHPIDYAQQNGMLL